MNTFLKRFLSLTMALVILLSSSNLGMVLQASAATAATTSAGEATANSYSTLTDAEKALLSSGYLYGDSVISYNVPDAGDDLVVVDNENCTITANDFEGWTATEARIMVGGELQQTIDLTSTDKYDPSVGNVFSVEVTYVLKQEIENQQTMLDAMSNLKQGATNLKDGYECTNTNLGTVVLALDTLVTLADGISMKFGGGGSVTVKFGAAAAAAIRALNAQAEANDGLLNLQVKNSEYSGSSTTEYLVENGSAYGAVFTSTYNYLKTINEDSLMGNGILDGYMQQNMPTEYKLWMALKSILSKLVEAMQPIAEAAWNTENLVNTETVDYTALDTLVAALGDITAIDTIENPLTVATTDIQVNMSMKNVTVTVKLETVENVVGSDKLISHAEVKTKTLTLADGTTAEQIRAEVENSGIAASAKEAWGDAYVEGGYDVVTTALPDTLTEDITYTITYTPKKYTVTRSYDSTITVPYGYQLQLPALEGADEETNYQYTVNGEVRYGGDVCTILGDTSVLRSDEVKKTVVTDFYTVVSENYGNALAQSILQSGALKGNTVIRVTKPNPETPDQYLTLADGKLTAVSVAADYENLNWEPDTYGASGTENSFSGNSADFTGKQAKVQYVLNLTNFTTEQVQEVLDLAAELKAQADTQTNTLDQLYEYYGTMGQLSITYLGALKGMVETTALSDDPERDAALKVYFTDIINGIIANNVDADNNLRIYNMLGEYGKEGLSYYYTNNAAILNEVEVLSGYLSDMLADDEKVEAMRRLLAAAGYAQYAENLKDLESAMAKVKNDLKAPDEAIDTTSTNLGKLTAALTANGTVENAAAGTAYLLADLLTIDDTSSASIQVIVEASNGKTATVTTEAMEKGTVLTQEVISDLQTKVAETVSTLLGGNEAYYDLKLSETTLENLVGTEISGSVYVRYTYTAKAYTVMIDGEENQTVTVENLEITLPKHPTNGWIYQYTIDGEVVERSAYTFTTAQLDKLFVDGSYTITRVGVNKAEEKLEGAFGDWIVRENGEITALNPEVDGSQDGMTGFVMELVNSGYNYIALNDEPLMYMTEDNSLEICLQSLVNAMLNDEEFTSESIIELGDGEGTFLRAKADLGSSADNLDYDDLDLIVDITSLPAEMQIVADGLVAVQDQTTFESNEGVMVLNMKLPEKVYELYMTSYLVTDGADLSDMNAVHERIASQLLWDYFCLITETEANTQTFDNTLKVLDQPHALTDYEHFYQKIKNLLEIDGVSFSESDTEKSDVRMTIKGEAAVSSLLELMGMEQDAYSVYLNYIKEYKDPTEEIIIETRGALMNPAVARQAAVLDIHAQTGLEKFDYAADAAASVADITGDGIVVLVADIAGNLEIGGNTILDLNGKTVSGNVNAKGNLLIVDSAKSGKITGSISGNVTKAVNALYSVEKDESANWNVLVDAGKITQSGIADFAKNVAVELAVDLIGSNAIHAALAAGSAEVYGMTVTDIISLYEGADSVEDLLNIAAGWVDAEKLNTFVNAVVDQLMDFDAVEATIRNGEAVGTFPVAATPWTVTASHDTATDCIIFGIAPSEDDGKTFHVSLKFTGNDAADLFGGLSDTAASGTVQTQVTGISASDRALAAAGTGSAVLALDLTADQNTANTTTFAQEDYAAVLAIALANSGSAQSEALVAAVKNGVDMNAFIRAFESVTAKEFVAAMNALTGDADISAMAAECGVTAADAAWQQAARVLAAAAPAGCETDAEIAMSETVTDDWYVVTAKQAAGQGVTLTEVTLKVKLAAKACVGGEAVIENKAEATCIADGSYDSVVYCVDCGKELSRETIVVPATGHTEAAAVAEKEVAATCTAGGSYDSVVYCSVCNVELSRKTIATEAKGHSWSDWSVKTEATTTKDGEKVRTCGVCGESETEIIPATGAPMENPFKDVPNGEWYTEAVLWAVDNGITEGYGSATKFAPNVECTRAQIVTFLWRAAGEPAPESSVNPFRDVPNDTWYTKAVLWAVEQGITTGYGSATVFNPDGICTRGQVATFLHRYFQQPDYTSSNPFTDVAEGEFYYDAVLWAVESGITNGYGSDTIFNPNGNCTRAQIVTFLYRALVK